MFAEQDHKSKKIEPNSFYSLEAFCYAIIFIITVFPSLFSPFLYTEKTKTKEQNGKMCEHFCVTPLLMLLLQHKLCQQ